MVAVRKDRSQPGVSVLHIFFIGAPRQIRYSLCAPVTVLDFRLPDLSSAFLTTGVLLTAVVDGGG